jgi:hypothetical protein
MSCGVDRGYREETFSASGRSGQPMVRGISREDEEERWRGRGGGGSVV